MIPPIAKPSPASLEARCLELSRAVPPLAAGSIHLCAGQEAIPVGAPAALRPTDLFVATYRGHGWALEAGITTRELILEVAHRARGINGGRAGVSRDRVSATPGSGQSCGKESGPLGKNIPLGSSARMNPCCRPSDSKQRWRGRFCSPRKRELRQSKIEKEQN